MHDIGTSCSLNHGIGVLGDRPPTRQRDRCLLSIEIQSLEQAGEIVTASKDTHPIVTEIRSLWWPHLDGAHRRGIPHPALESDIPASTQLYNQICTVQRGIPGRVIASRCARQLAMQTGLHRNTISKVYRQLETDGVVEAMAGSGIYVRDQQKPREIKAPPHIRNRGVTDLDREVRQCVDGLLNAGCTLQQTRELLTREIDWRLRCGARVLVSTPREDIGASMLIAEELEPHLDVPVEVVPLEELENVLDSSSNGTVVTSRYSLQPVEELAKKHTVRRGAPQRLPPGAGDAEGTAAGQLRQHMSIRQKILRAAEVIPTRCVATSFS